MGTEMTAMRHSLNLAVASLLAIRVAVVATAALPPTPDATAASKVQLLDDRALVNSYKQLLECVPNQQSDRGSFDRATVKAIKAEFADRSLAKWHALVDGGPTPEAFEDLPEEQLYFLSRRMPRDSRDLAPRIKKIYDRVGRAIIRRGGTMRTDFLTNYHFSDVSGLDDADLLGILQDMPTLQWQGAGEENYDRVIAEVARRGGKTWEKVLSDELDKFENNRINGHGFPGSSLGILTALRRAQGKPDPVSVIIEAGDGAKLVFAESMSMDVTIKNLDIDKRSVWITEGGLSFGSWRVRIIDSQSKAIPALDLAVDIVGGRRFRELKFGGVSQTSLDLKYYVDLLPPGDYSIEISYHESILIGGMANVDGLNVCRSAPAKIHVAPLVLELTLAQRSRLKRLVDDLSGNQPTVVLQDTYGKWAEPYIPANSPEGELLSARMASVPFLVDGLSKESLTPEKRAQILSILYSLTQRNNPREQDGLVGAWLQAGIDQHLDIESGHWWNEVVAKEYRDQIDVEKQKEFAARWKKWKDYVLLKDRPSASH